MKNLFGLHQNHVCIVLLYSVQPPPLSVSLVHSQLCRNDVCAAAVAVAPGSVCLPVPVVCPPPPPP